MGSGTGSGPGIGGSGVGGSAISLRMSVPCPPCAWRKLRSPCRGDLDQPFAPSPLVLTQPVGAVPRARVTTTRTPTVNTWKRPSPQSRSQLHHRPRGSYGVSALLSGW
jgi:hypothetical protein